MILLDTDHLTLLKYPDSERGAQLAEKLRSMPLDVIVAVSIISVEEQMRGWLAAIAKERQTRRQVPAYGELARLFAYFRAFTILPFDERAADRFDELRAAKIRLGAMDLKSRRSLSSIKRCCSPPTAATSSKCPPCESKTGSTSSAWLPPSKATRGKPVDRAANRS